MGYQLQRRLARYEAALKQIEVGDYAKGDHRLIAIKALSDTDPEDGTKESHDLLSIELAKIIAWHHSDRKQWVGAVPKEDRNRYYAEHEWRTFLPAGAAIASALSPMIVDQSAIDGYMIKTCVRETMEALGHDADMKDDTGKPVWESIIFLIHNKMNEETGR